MSPRVLGLHSTIPKKSIGRLCCDRLWGLSWKMTPPAGPTKNQICPIVCSTCLPFFPKVIWAPFLRKASGPDLQNKAPCMTKHRIDMSIHVLDLLSTFPKKSFGHLSCERLRGLTWKMKALA